MFSTALYRRMGPCPARFRIRHGLPLALALILALGPGAARAIDEADTVEDAIEQGELFCNMLAARAELLRGIEE